MTLASPRNKFKAVVKSISDGCLEYLTLSNRIILFNYRLCPEILVEVCTLIRLLKALKEPIVRGDVLCLKRRYKKALERFMVIKVGDAVYDTLSELGHCTITYCTEDSDQNIIPGEIQVLGSAPVLQEGDIITILAGE